MDIETGEHEGEQSDVGTREGDAHDASTPAAAIDIAKLTAKVYRLMLDELRLERARGATVRNG